MFLSKLVVNLRHRQARFDLARPYEMHRTLMNAYPHGRRDNHCDLLYRLESSRTGPPTVLVQTRERPDWSALAPGYLLAPSESKSLELPVSAGQRLRFRLRANPTKRVHEKNERLGPVMVGRRVGLTGECDQLRWLLRKGDGGGFRVPGEWVDASHPETGTPVQLPNFRVDLVPEGRDRNDKPNHGGEFLAVRFDGILTVTDPDRFRATVTAGIGSGKAFGFGLLSIAPAHR
jgi:CRISPR system Cascade subunit CasE